MVGLRAKILDYKGSSENKLKAALLKVEELEKELTVHKSKQQAVCDENKRISSEKKCVEAKHIKTCEDLKILKQENEDLAKAKNTLSVALKRQTKVNQEQARNVNKEASKLRKSVEELTEFKNKIVDKDNHEKNLRRNSLRKLSKLPEKNLKKR